VQIAGIEFAGLLADPTAAVGHGHSMTSCFFGKGLDTAGDHGQADGLYGPVGSADCGVLGEQLHLLAKLFDLTGQGGHVVHRLTDSENRLPGGQVRGLDFFETLGYRLERGGDAGAFLAAAGNERRTGIIGQRLDAARHSQEMLVKPRERTAKIPDGQVHLVVLQLANFSDHRPGGGVAGKRGAQAVKRLADVLQALPGDILKLQGGNQFPEIFGQFRRTSLQVICLVGTVDTVGGNFAKD